MSKLQERKTLQEERVLRLKGIEWDDTFGYVSGYDDYTGASLTVDYEEITNILKQ